MKIYSRLIQDGKPVLGTTFSRVHNLKTWEGVAKRLLKGPRPDHLQSHIFECEAYFEGESGYTGYSAIPCETRRIKITLTQYQIGHVIYKG